MHISLTLSLLACGGAGGATVPVTADLSSDDDDDEAPAEERLVPTSPPGSRISLALPASAVRAPHSLVYHDAARGLSIAIADATVEPGTERTVAEEGLEGLGPSARARPMAMAGAEGVEVSLETAEGPLRALTLWRDGALVRVLLRHQSEDAILVERILDSLRFDPRARIDPRAALETAATLEGLALAPVSNELLVFRAAGQASGFPSATPGAEVTFVAFALGARPSSDRERGLLLGARFAGLSLAGTAITPLDAGEGAPRGFEIVSTTERDAAPLALYGAYVEGEHGAWLVRASVAQEHAAEWGPRFRALVAALETP